MDQAEGDRGQPTGAPSVEPGKPPTMEDVATRAGVSRALVSIVFRGLPGASPENRERVRRAAAELGFRPDRRASLLGSKRTNLLGVAFGVGHEFHADLISTRLPPSTVSRSSSAASRSGGPSSRRSPSCSTSAATRCWCWARR